MTGSILGLRTFTVTRFSVGAYVAGDWSDTPDPPFTVEGSAQSERDRELELLPPGERTTHPMKLYCDTFQAELFTVDLAAPRRADRVSVDGRDLEVVGKRNWSWDDGGCPHFEYTLEEVGVDEVIG